MTSRTPLLLAAVLTAFVSGVNGQTLSPTVPPTKPARPEVHADGTVTFSLPAPNARQVSVRLDREWPMTRDQTGLWTVTVGPLLPDIYEYQFVVDGTRVLDSRNPFVKPGDFPASLVEVTGPPTLFQQWQDVPHGTLQLLSYTSTPFRVRRNLWVFVPAEYRTHPQQSFPVVYLRHGNGDDEGAWPFEGRAGVILENLIAAGKATPMLLVMPYGEGGASGGSPDGIAALDRELHEDVMPLVERTFRVVKAREGRAIAGLSMGGRQALTTGLQHLGEFAWVGAFSSGGGPESDTRVDRMILPLTENADAVNSLRLLFLSCGTEDPRFASHRELRKYLDGRRIRYVWYGTEGNHEFKVWRHSLYEFLQRVFQPAAPAG